MNEKLFNYQIEGANWLHIRKFALLADEQGLGKSAQAITACNIISAKRILLICPAVVRINWEREFKKFSIIDYEFQIVVSSNEKITRSKSIIISYDLAANLTPTDFGNFDILILDESQYLKSINAKRTQKILGVNGYARQCQKIWALSGTPTPNHAGELWPILFTWGATRLKYNPFIEKFCITKRSNFGGRTVNQIIGTKISAIPDLKEILKPIMLRRKTESVLKELPPISFNNVYVEPGMVELDMMPSFADYYAPGHNMEEKLLEKIAKENKLVHDTLSHIQLGPEGMMVLEGLAKSVSTLRRYIGLQKVDAVVEMVTEELEADKKQKIVIFAYHNDVMMQLMTRLRKFNPVAVRGGTPGDKRQKNIDKFQSNPRTRVFVGQIIASGTGITLTAANQIIFIEQDWVPGNNMQAAKRCHRIGQTRPVFVRCITIPDTIDERISHVLRRKTSELAALFDKELLANAIDAFKDEDSSLD